MNLRIRQPGGIVKDIVFGPGVGRRAFGHGSVYGGTLVIGDVPKRSPAEEAARRAKQEYERRYYAEHKEEALERQRRYRARVKDPCNRVMRGGGTCAKGRGHAPHCAGAASLEKDALQRRARR